MQTNYYTFVNGVNGAKAYPIMPNQSIMLMDTDNPVCYMKTADSTGKPYLKCYKLVEIPEEELTRTPVDPAIKDELTTINKRIDDLFKMLEEKNNG